MRADDIENELDDLHERLGALESAQSTLHDRVAMAALTGLLCQEHPSTEAHLLALYVADAYMAEKARREAGDES